MAKWEITTKGEKSVTSETSRVRNREDSLSAQNRNGLRSMQTF